MQIPRPLPPQREMARQQMQQESLKRVNVARTLEAERAVLLKAWDEADAT